jgi:hypothetical protein
MKAIFNLFPKTSPKKHAIQTYGGDVFDTTSHKQTAGKQKQKKFHEFIKDYVGQRKDNLLASDLSILILSDLHN